jgi:protein transport protein SEC61 subunit gamma-like protein
MSDRSFLDKSWDAQRKFEKKLGSLGKGKYARVLRMARKPSPEEFRRTANIVVIGIAVIGGIGFAVFLFMDWLQRIIGAS